MATVLLVIHIMIALALIGVVLLQRSEGGALGIGGGGGGGFMTGRGAANFLTRVDGGAGGGVLRHQPGPVADGVAAGRDRSILEQGPAPVTQPARRPSRCRRSIRRSLQPRRRRPPTRRRQRRRAAGGSARAAVEVAGRLARPDLRVAWA